jgi:hypothetical protein
MSLTTDEAGLLITGANRRVRTNGLLSSIEPIYLDDKHWQAGIEWESDCSIEVNSTLPPCPAPVAAKAEDGGLLFCHADPFTVYGNYKCSTGGRPAGDSRAISAHRLDRNKERGVEQIFWTGMSSVGPINPSLQGGNESCMVLPVDLTPINGSLDIIGAIAALESNIADCIPGGLGVIHVNYGVLPYLVHNLLARKENDGNFYTPSGQLVIAGAGYPGSGPGNVPASPGETWVFATGPIAVYASDIFFTPSDISQAIDRSLNNISFYAEQTYSVIWECCSFAVRVNLC